MGKVKKESDLDFVHGQLHHYRSFIAINQGAVKVKR